MPSSLNNLRSPPGPVTPEAVPRSASPANAPVQPRPRPERQDALAPVLKAPKRKRDAVPLPPGPVPAQPRKRPRGNKFPPYPPAWQQVSLDEVHTIIANRFDDAPGLACALKLVQDRCVHLPMPQQMRLWNTYALAYTLGHVQRDPAVMDFLTAQLAAHAFTPASSNDISDYQKAMLLLWELRPTPMALNNVQLHATLMNAEQAVFFLYHAATYVLCPHKNVTSVLEEIATRLMSHGNSCVRQLAINVSGGFLLYGSRRDSYDFAGGLVLDEAAVAVARIYNVDVPGLPMGEDPSAVYRNMAQTDAALRQGLGLSEEQNNALDKAMLAMAMTDTVECAADVDLWYGTATSPGMVSFELTPLRLVQRGGRASHAVSLTGKRADDGTYVLQLHNKGGGAELYHQHVAPILKKDYKLSAPTWKKFQTTGNCSSCSFRMAEAAIISPEAQKQLRHERRVFMAMSLEDELKNHPGGGVGRVGRGVLMEVRAKEGLRVAGTRAEPVALVDSAFTAAGIAPAYLHENLRNIGAAIEPTYATMHEAHAALYGALGATTTVQALRQLFSLDEDMVGVVVDGLKQLGFVEELGPYIAFPLRSTDTFAAACTDRKQLIEMLEKANAPLAPPADVWNRVIDHLLVRGADTHVGALKAMGDTVVETLRSLGLVEDLPPIDKRTLHLTEAFATAAADRAQLISSLSGPLWFTWIAGNDVAERLADYLTAEVHRHGYLKRTALPVPLAT